MSYLQAKGLNRQGRTLAAFCARYEEKISTIVNLGIAGGLTAQLTQGENISGAHYLCSKVYPPSRVSEL